MLDPNSPGMREHGEPEDESKAKRRQRSRRLTQGPLRTDPHSLKNELQRDRGLALLQPIEADWAEQSPEVLEQNYQQAEADYFDIVDDYLAQANLATERYKESSNSHARWRFWMIVATGVLAVLNTFAALKLIGDSKTLSIWLSAAAAVYAVILTIAGNIEGFRNRGEKAAGFRESRDLLLDKYREYYFKWFYYVESYGKGPRASINAARLYRELVVADQELRQKLKQLTEVHPRRGADAKSTATAPH
jgi:hypothetical protein